MSKFKRTLKGLTDGTKSKAIKIVDSDAKVVTKAKDLATDVGRKYAKSGTKGKVDAVQSQISGKFDEISGQAMYQLVQERLAEQDRFNEVDPEIRTGS